MNPPDLPSVLKLAERLTLEVEAAVRGFARYHKYTLGSDLRSQAMQVWRLANRAWRDRPRTLDWLSKLVWAVDEVKFSLQAGRQLKAFRSFKQFELLARIASDIGRQVGGWLKQQHLKRQNPPAQSSGPAERPHILSSPAASDEGAYA